MQLIPSVHRPWNITYLLLYAIAMNERTTIEYDKKKCVSFAYSNPVVVLSPFFIFDEL